MMGICELRKLFCILIVVVLTCVNTDRTRHGKKPIFHPEFLYLHNPELVLLFAGFKSSQNLFFRFLPPSLIFSRKCVPNYISLHV